MNKRQILPWVAMVVSATAIIISLCRIEPIVYDWIGGVVGTLAILVTALIGWQIYSAWDIVRRTNESIATSEAFRKEVVREQYRSQCAVYGALHEFYRITGTEVMQYLKYSLLSIEYASLMGEFELCNSVIWVLEESITKDAESRSADKALLYKHLTNIPNQRAISSFPALIELFARIRIVQVS